MNVPMVNLKGQYQKIKSEIDAAIIDCLASSAFINGPQVKVFQTALEKFLDVKHVIPCANGTDALQIAMMALDLSPGDEIICPAFTYVATAEVMALLGLKPVMVDVDPDTFNLDPRGLEKIITPRTKAIVPVHLFGQSAAMESIMAIAKKYNLFVIEDNAQSTGADYIFENGSLKKTGTIGHIGCTSFFPSKNLGCYGDGGALMTDNDDLAKKIRMIANHGQEKKYYHKVLGCNSRLDTLQAAVLEIKLKHLDAYNQARRNMAEYYDEHLSQIPGVQIPTRVAYSSHVFHQYTLKVDCNKRDALHHYLAEKGIASMIYYPLPLYHQEAFRHYVHTEFNLPVTEQLCKEVISLPIHTEPDRESMEYTVAAVRHFFSKTI